MGELFRTTPENVLMHLRNIYAEQELDEVATDKDFLAVGQEGMRLTMNLIAEAAPTP